MAQLAGQFLSDTLGPVFKAVGKFLTSGTWYEYEEDRYYTHDTRSKHYQSCKTGSNTKFCLDEKFKCSTRIKTRRECWPKFAW